MGLIFPMVQFGYKEVHQFLPELLHMDIPKNPGIAFNYIALVLESCVKVP